MTYLTTGLPMSPEGRAENEACASVVDEMRAVLAQGGAPAVALGWSPTMPRPDIEAALARAEAALEGPFHCEEDDNRLMAGGGHYCIFDSKIEHVVIRTPVSMHGHPHPTHALEALVRFLAQARTDLPAIARYALELEEMVYGEHHSHTRDGFPEACFCPVCTAVRARGAAESKT